MNVNVNETRTCEASPFSEVVLPCPLTMRSPILIQQEEEEEEEEEDDDVGMKYINVFPIHSVHLVIH